MSELMANHESLLAHVIEGATHGNYRRISLSNQVSIHATQRSVADFSTFKDGDALDIDFDRLTDLKFAEQFVSLRDNNGFTFARSHYSSPPPSVEDRRATLSRASRIS